MGCEKANVILLPFINNKEDPEDMISCSHIPPYNQRQFTSVHAGRARDKGRIGNTPFFIRTNFIRKCIKTIEGFCEWKSKNLFMKNKKVRTNFLLIY